MALARPVGLPQTWLNLSLAYGAETGQWLWHYSTYVETGLEADLQRTYRLELDHPLEGFLDCGLDQMLHRLRSDAYALPAVEPF